jgi:restriction system protein
MAIPSAQSMLWDVLKLFEDRQLKDSESVYKFCVEKFKPTPQELQIKSSGSEGKFRNNARWAITHLTKAELLEKPARNRIRITDMGISILQEPEKHLRFADLKQISEKYYAWSRPKDGKPSIVSNSIPRKTVAIENETIAINDDFEDSSLTPDQQMETSFGQIVSVLQDSLLATVKSSSPEFFEKLVLDLLVQMGYGGGSRDEAALHVGKTGDGGIDGIIKEDKLGLDVICVQAKRWEGVVGRPVVQAFAGSLEGRRAKKGVMTTSRYSDDAKEFVKTIEKRIALIDGYELAELMIGYGVGVSTDRIYEIKRIDSDYFEEDYS